MAEFEELDAKKVAALERIASALERIDEKLGSVIGNRQDPSHPQHQWNVVMTEDRSKRS